MAPVKARVTAADDGASFYNITGNSAGYGTIKDITHAHVWRTPATGQFMIYATLKHALAYN